MSTPTPELLKSCPFCGDADVFVERSDFTSSYVMCSACGAQGATECQEDDDEDVPGKQAAIKAWNTRPANPLSPAEAERIKAALKDAVEDADIRADARVNTQSREYHRGRAERFREALALLEKAAGGQ